MLSTRKSNLMFFNPDYENLVRFLPNKNPNKDFFLEFLCHRVGNNIDMGFNSILGRRWELCSLNPLSGAKKPCKYCSKWHETRNPDSKPHIRVAFNIYNYRIPTAGSMVWITSIHVLEQLLNYMSNPKYGDITDLVRGRDVIITRQDIGIAQGYEVKIIQERSKFKLKCKVINLKTVIKNLYGVPSSVLVKKTGRMLRFEKFC